MPDETMWKELLGTLKDISTYLEKSEDLEKQMSNQTRAKVDKPPKAGEEEFAIEGGPAAPNRPGEGVAKQYIDIPDAPTPGRKTREIGPGEDGSTLLKQDDDKSDGKKGRARDEDSEDSESDSESTDGSESDEGSPMESNDELKSLLKDIHSALVDQSALQKALPEMVKAEVKKSFEKQLRKEGFSVTHPDVVRFNPDVSKSGLDTIHEIQNSGERAGADIKKSEDPNVAKEQDLRNTVNELEKLDWRKLGQLREKIGLFNPFDNQ